MNLVKQSLYLCIGTLLLLLALAASFWLARKAEKDYNIAREAGEQQLALVKKNGLICIRSVHYKILRKVRFHLMKQDFQ